MNAHEHVLSFVTRFVLSAVLGSAVIIGVAPLLRPETLPAWLHEPASQIRAVPVLARTADRLAATLLWDATPRKVSLSVPTPLAAGSSPAGRTAPAASPSPTTARARPAPGSSAHHWGVISRAGTEVYRSSGDVPLRLPVGTALHVQTRRADREGFISCQLPLPRGALSQPFSVQARQITVYQGHLDQLDNPTLESAQQLARLQSDRTLISAKSAAPDRAGNPQLATLKRTRDALAAHQEKARGIQQQFEKATGNERMRLGDELRVMKATELQLQQAYKPAKAAYDAWNAENPAADSAASQDPRLAALAQEIATLADRLPPPVDTAP